MKTILTILITVIIITGCNTSNVKNVNESNLKTYFSSIVKKNDSTTTVVSFQFVKLDTTTLRNQFFLIYNKFSDQLDNDEFDFKKLVDKIKSNSKIASLYSDLDYKLYKNYRDEADDAAKKAKELLTKDSLIQIDLNKVDTLISKADTVRPVGYVAKCSYTLKKLDQSVSKDTFTIRLNLDFEIISPEEYQKSLVKVYKPVSNFNFD